jgi:hypothetical protein
MSSIDSSAFNGKYKQQHDIAGGEWSASRPCRFTPGERAPGTHWIGGWVGPRAGLDDVEGRLELRPLGRPARSQSLYRLSHNNIRWRIQTVKLLMAHLSPASFLTKYLIYRHLVPDRTIPTERPPLVGEVTRRPT